MHKIKVFLIATFFILTCMLLLSCQSPLEKNETNDASNIHFTKVSYAENLFNTMSEDNCYDVTDFSLDKIDGNLTDVLPIIGFSYIPPELRIFNIGDVFYHNSECFSGLSIDTFYAVECFKSIMEIKPIQVLKPDSDRLDDIIESFSNQYGIAYSLRFIHNSHRNAEKISIVEKQTSYDFFISPITKNDTYYLFDKNTLTLAEVDAESLSFLKTPAEDWYDPFIFRTHIGFVDKIEIHIKNGTTDGIRGVTDLSLKQTFTDQNGMPLHPLEVVSSGPDAIFHVTARYHGQNVNISDIPKYRKFYLGLLTASVREITLNEKLQEQLEDTIPDMTIKFSLECDDEYFDRNATLEYRFFADNSVMVNGFYIGKLTNGQFDALIRSVGLMLSPDADDVIDFW